CGSVAHSGRGGGKLRKNDAGQHNDTALQADGGIAFEESDADAAGGLSRETGQGDRRDGGGHVELEKAGVNGQDHNEGENPDKQRPQQSDRPEGDGFQQSYTFNGGNEFL